MLDISFEELNSVELIEPPNVVQYHELPKIPVKELRGAKVWDVDGEEVVTDFCSAKTISTYPYLAQESKRDGDPNADRLFMSISSNRVIAAIADGCNWGTRPQLAARNAIAAFGNYLKEKQEQIRDLQDVGHFLYRAFCEAHNKIVEGKEDIWEAGTTTLLGGLLVEFEENDHDYKWGFVCASVGDCKAFHWNHKTREVNDITSGNRSNLSDTRDPGGRLGPYVGDGWPDLRNLRIYFSPCERKDIITIVSDGVHDNFDPQMLGISPKYFNLAAESWEQVSDAVALRAKSRYMKLALEKVFNEEKPTPEFLTSRLCGHALETTKKAREFMEKHPNTRQPTNYFEFPGKMDHTTAISVLVGRISFLEDDKVYDH